jgi:hypothetical protein
MEAIDTDSMGSDSNHGSQGQFGQPQFGGQFGQGQFHGHLFRNAEAETQGNAIYQSQTKGESIFPSKILFVR